MKESTTTEIRHYKDVEDENVKQMLTEEILDPDSIIKLSQEDVNRFLSNRGTLLKVFSKGNDPRETVSDAFSNAKYEDREVYDSQHLLVNVIISKDMQFEGQMALMDELKVQFDKYATEDATILWALIRKEQEQPIHVLLYAIFQ